MQVVTIHEMLDKRGRLDELLERYSITYLVHLAETGEGSVSHG